jgi:2-haloacid dehalogenase
MVAAHKGDLRAAKAAGLKAAFVPRPLEYGPGRKADVAPDAAFEIVARDFLDLADKLDAPKG